MQISKRLIKSKNKLFGIKSENKTCSKYSKKDEKIMNSFLLDHSIGSFIEVDLTKEEFRIDQEKLEQQSRFGHA